MEVIELVGSVKTATRATADDTYRKWRGTRCGIGFVADWRVAHVMEGIGYMVNVGAFSTPIVGGGNGNIIDQNQPEFIISVPNNTCIMPIRVEISCQAPLLASDSDEMEILLAVDQDAAWAADGTATTETVYNMNTLHSNATNCTARSAFTADATNPVLDLELMHKVKVGDVMGSAGNGIWSELYGLYEPAVPVIINGPAMLVGYWGGTVATSGFASIQWLELPETAFS